MSNAEKHTEIAEKIIDLLSQFPAVESVGILEVVKVSMIKAMIDENL